MQPGHMLDNSQPSPHSRRRSSETPTPYQPPLKKRKRRRWCDVVQSRALANGVEEDGHRIAQRQKQIDYGKNTIAYDRFIALCPRDSRTRGDPMTPLPRQKCSKRSFAGQITSWKKQVYAYVANLDEKLKASELSPSCKSDKEISERVPSQSGQHDVNHSVTPCESNNPGEAESHTVTGQPFSGSENQEDEDFSDMDDIELDDLGNVIGDTPSPSAKKHDATTARNPDVSPASIFDAF